MEKLLPRSVLVRSRSHLHLIHGRLGNVYPGTLDKRAHFLGLDQELDGTWLLSVTSAQPLLQHALVTCTVTTAGAQNIHSVPPRPAPRSRDACSEGGWTHEKPGVFHSALIHILQRLRLSIGTYSPSQTYPGFPLWT